MAEYAGKDVVRFEAEAYPPVSLSSALNMNQNSFEIATLVGMDRSFLSTRQYLLVFGLLALLVLSAGGCGGGDAEAQLSKAAYIKRANRICNETREKTQQGFVAYARQNQVPESGPTLNAEAADFVGKVFTPIYEQQLDQLEALNGPSADQEKTTKILASMRSALKTSQQEPLKFIRGAPFFEEASALATAYGMTDCTG